MSVTWGILISRIREKERFITYLMKPFREIREKASRK